VPNYFCLFTSSFHLANPPFHPWQSHPQVPFRTLCSQDAQDVHGISQGQIQGGWKAIWEAD
jgi:hypothetical protein